LHFLGVIAYPLSRESNWTGLKRSRESLVSMTANAELFPFAEFRFLDLDRPLYAGAGKGLNLIRSAREHGCHMYKILIVDDEPELLRIYQEEFSEEGYGVLLANSGKEALDILARESPDLVVLDIRMPTMNGMEAFVAMMGKNRMLPVILHSAYPEYRENFLTLGAEAFVQKTHDLEPLKKIIREILEKTDKRKTAD